MIIKTIKFMYYYNNGNISKFERLVFSGIQKIIKNILIKSHYDKLII